MGWHDLKRESERRMMKRLRIYLDTSVINFLFVDDAPEFRKITEDFFRNYVKPQKYEVYVSNVALAEIERTPDEERRSQLLGAIREYGLNLLTVGDEAARLADVYLQEGIVPAKKIEDAQHIAIATCHQLDVLLSWNFKHLANIQKQWAVRIVNEREGYFYPLLLTNPMEVLYEND